MTLKTAQRLIRDASASFEQHAEAAAVICDGGQSNVDDLMACLDYAGLPSELAKTVIRTQLSSRTGRKVKQSAR
jgi:hypothetical protein